MRALPDDDLRLLRDIVSRRDPDALGLVASIGSKPLTLDARERLRGLLADELAEAGLGPDDEPTKLGERIDNMISELGSA